VLGALAKHIVNNARRTEGFRRGRRKSKLDWHLYAGRVR
jgi:hypothetical protein